MAQVSSGGLEVNVQRVQSERKLQKFTGIRGNGVMRI
jgi:hypothetical protein